MKASTPLRFLVICGQVVEAIDAQIAAIVPTESGQIGVNPPDATSITASIGVDTQYLTDIGGTSTKWIGVDPWFGTATITSTASGGAVTTVPIHKGFSVSKNADGKIDIAMSDELKGIVEDIFAKAPACSASKARRLRKRQNCEARFNYVAEQYGANSDLQAASQQLAEDVAAESGGIAEGEAIQFGVEGVEDLGALIRIMYPTLTASEIDVAAGAVITSAGVIVSIYALSQSLDQITYKFSAGTPQIVKVQDVADEITDSTQAPTPTTVTSTTSSTSSCPTETQDLPPCDDDCQPGDTDKKCTIGDLKGCECVEISNCYGFEWYPDWLQVQQSLFSAASEAPPATTSSPSATATIDCSKVTDVPGKCGVPGCAYVIASNLGSNALCQGDYCNCGGKVAPLLTTTASGTTGLGCGYTAVPTCNDCTRTTCDPPEPTETKTVTPLDQTTDRTCWSESDFPGHADVNSGDVSTQAMRFCLTDGSPFSPNRDKPEATLYSDFSKVHTYTRRETNAWGVNYDFEVDWKEGCTTSQDSQGVAYPTDPKGLSGLSCMTIMEDNFHKCNNGGVGGEIQVGCLVYRFWGARMFLIYRYEGHVFTMDLCGLNAHDTWYLLDDFHEAFNDMKLVECRARYPASSGVRKSKEWKRLFTKFGEPELVNDLPTPKIPWDKSPKGIHVKAVSATDIKAYHEVQREMALGCLSTPSFEVLSEKRTMNDFIRGVFFRYYMNHMKYWIENEAHIYSVAMDGEVRGGCMVEEINRRTLSWRYADLPHGETAVNKLSGVQDMQDFWNADQALKLARTEYDVLKWQRHVNEDRPFWYLTGIHIGQGHWRGSKGLETRLLQHIIGAKGEDSGIFVLCEHDNVELYESERFIKVDYVQMRSKRVRENTAKRIGDPNRTHLYTTLSGMWRPADHESSRCAVDRGETPRVFRPEVAALFTGQAGRYI